MKTLFVYPALGKTVRYHMGIGYLSSCLKKAGHTTSVLKVNRNISESRFAEALDHARPDMVAITCLTNYLPYVHTYAAWTKRHRPGVPVVVGGVHATLCPEDTIADPNIDLVAVGEYESVVADLAARVDDHAPLTDLPSSWVRGRDGEIHSNPTVPFLDDIDGLPFPDRRILFKDSIPSLDILAGRGCPYNCAYCSNHAQRTRQSGRYVRFRSPENVVAEISHVTRHYRVNRVCFPDDIFTLKKRWVLEFLDQYRRAFRFPFVANAQIAHMDDDVLKALKEAGCEYLCVGVESGDPKLRRDVLRRKMLNEEIIEAFDRAKKHGVMTYAFYMLGIPFENEAGIKATMALHERLRPEKGFQISVYYPFPGTDLYDVARKSGMLTDRAVDTFEEGTSTLALPGLPPDTLRRYFKIFEDMRLESGFGDAYVKSNYPSLFRPYRAAAQVLGKGRVLRTLRRARDLLLPACELADPRPDQADPVVVGPAAVAAEPVAAA